jgi:hypothetical protein
MREGAAVVGPGVIDRATLFLKKMAGHCLKSVFAFFLRRSKVIVDYLRFRNTEVLGQSPYISRGEDRGHDLAAIRARTAVDFGHDYLQVAPHDAIQRGRRQVSAFEVRPESPVIVFVLLGKQPDSVNVLLDKHYSPIVYELCGSPRPSL